MCERESVGVLGSDTPKYTKHKHGVNHRKEIFIYLFLKRHFYTYMCLCAHAEPVIKKLINKKGQPQRRRRHVVGSPAGLLLLR